MRHASFFIALALGATLSFLPLQKAEAFFGGPGKQVPVETGTNKVIWGYYEYLPQNYSETSGEKFPVVIFLHGLGEVGDGKLASLPKVLANGPPKMIKNGNHFPAIVVSPQSVGGHYTGGMNSFLNFVLSTYKAADPDRVYVTGLSMGGGDTWDFAKTYPDRVAAIVPIAGNRKDTQISNAQAFVDIPMWVFHAYDDKTIPYSNSTNIIQKITPPNDVIMNGYVKNVDALMVFSRKSQLHSWQAGVNTTKTIDLDSRLRMTMYATGGHDSWTRAYNNQDMWKWLLSWKRGGILVGTEVPPTTPPVVTPPTTPPTTPPVTSGKLQVDFGSSDVLPTGWNNFRINVSGLQLKEAAGKETNAKLVRVVAPRGVNSGGTSTADPSLGFPVATTQDSVFGNTGLHGGIAVPKVSYELQGLDPSKQYSFEFFASRIKVNDIRSAKYTVTNGSASVTTSLNASNNTSKKATTTGIKPSADGRLRLDITKGADNNEPTGYFYLGNMVVKY